MAYTEVLTTLDTLKLLYLSLKCSLTGIMHGNLMKAGKSPIHSYINQVTSTMSWCGSTVTVELTVTSPALETLA